MRYHEITGISSHDDDLLRAVLNPDDYAEVQRIIGGADSATKSAIISDLVRSPPTTMSPDEMLRMYGIDTIDDQLEREKLWSEILKLRADAARLGPAGRNS